MREMRESVRSSLELFSSPMLPRVRKAKAMLPNAKMRTAAVLLKPVT